MMDVTQLVRQAVPGGYPSTARGYILKAPLSFSEGVSVVLPEGSSEHTYGPCKWGAIHGTRLPAAGAECVVCFDEQNQPTVVWWSGTQKEPAAIAELETKVAALEARKSFKVSAAEAEVERKAGEALEPSATKDALVSLRMNVVKGKVAVLEFTVGGTKVTVMGSVEAPATELVLASAIAVAAGKKWEAKLALGEAAGYKLFSSYTFLD